MDSKDLECWVKEQLKQSLQCNSIETACTAYLKVLKFIEDSKDTSAEVNYNCPERLAFIESTEQLY